MEPRPEPLEGVPDRVEVKRAGQPKGLKVAGPMKQQMQSVNIIIVKNSVQTLHEVHVPRVKYLIGDARVLFQPLDETHNVRLEMLQHSKVIPFRVFCCFLLARPCAGGAS